MCGGPFRVKKQIRGAFHFESPEHDAFDAGLSNAFSNLEIWYPVC